MIEESRYKRGVTMRSKSDDKKMIEKVIRFSCREKMKVMNIESGDLRIVRRH